MATREDCATTTRSKLAAVVGAFLTILVGADAYAQYSDLILEYSPDPETVVISFDLAGNSASEMPLLRIFGDGRVLVHREVGKEYVMYFSDEQIRSWIKYLYDQGVLAFDASNLKKLKDTIEQARNERKRQRGELILSKKLFDVGPSIIEINLAEFRPNEGTALVTKNFSHVAAWTHPRLSSEEFPEIPELARFADAVEALLALSRDPALSPVR